MSAEAVRATVFDRFAASGDGSVPESDNEFVIFSKPELGRLVGSDLGRVWDLFAGKLAEHAVEVLRTKIVTGPQLEQAGAMQQHYGVINQISRLGRPALTESAEEALGSVLAETSSDALVLGGHQFLDCYPGFSSFSLAMLFSNADVRRLGPGTYAAAVTIDGTPVIVLNGFHPRQLGFFTAADTVCAFMHASSRTDWDMLRSAMIGATDPSQAAPESIRGTLYADPSAYGLSAVNSNFNGVHMSAGPLEGLGELDRFFGEVRPATGWAFARTLRAAGATDDDIARLGGNPVLEADGERGTAYDLTEGINADAAATLLVNARRV
jgi:hypothetical protein